MKNNMRKLMLKLGGLACSVAAFVAVYSVNIACTGKYYQAELPKSLTER